MAARALMKRLATTVNVPRTTGGDISGYFLRQGTTRINLFSTAIYKHTKGTGSMRDGQYEQGSNLNNESTTSYVAEKAKEGVKKATDTAINTGETMKDAMEGAWNAAKQTGQNISEAVAGEDEDERIQEDKVAVELKEVKQPVDTTEYRGIEELRQQTGACNNSS